MDDQENLEGTVDLILSVVVGVLGCSLTAFFAQGSMLWVLAWLSERL